MANKDHYQRIWKVVQAIPEGNVASYGQVADLAGLPGRARLAGKSLSYVPEVGYNGKHVPWYRVVRSSGQLAFPIESESFTTQRNLLMNEGVFVKGRSVSLKTFGWKPSLSEILFSLEQ